VFRNWSRFKNLTTFEAKNPEWKQTTAYASTNTLVKLATAQEEQQTNS
jgi:hypothetical protein